MKRLAFALAALCGGFVIHAQPAIAAITASFTLNIQTNYTGPCPVAAIFTGSINGPAGTSVTYIFSHFVNGSSNITGPMTGTIPANGMLPISETLNIDVAHSGFQSNEVDVTSPQAAQSKTYFTVTCAATGGTPQPAASGPINATNVHVVDVLIPAPTNLTRTNDPQDCGAHGAASGLFGSALCGNAIISGAPVLVWSWSPQSPCPTRTTPPFATCPTDIDGYHVYKTSASRFQAAAGGLTGATLLDTMSLGPNVTFSMSKNLKVGDCYVVRAFKQHDESANSNVLCMRAGQSVSKTQTIYPGHWRPYHIERSKQGTVFLTTGKFSCVSTLGCVGHQYDSATGVVDSYDNEVWRFAVWFDVGSLHASTIYKADLKFAASDFYHRSPADLCLRNITPGAGAWWVNVTYMQPDPSMSQSIAVLHGALQSIDVTSLVRSWLASPNYGFILSGDEDLYAFTNESCIDNYDKIWLEVTYQ